MSEERLTVTGGLMPAMDVETYVRRWKTMTHLVKSVMKENQHYGTIPGTNKPTLLKPGAEMLTTFFGLRTTFTSKRIVEDWTGVDHGGEPFFYYLETCQLWRGDTLMAEADGSANSHESRYRWRWVLKEDIPIGLDIASLKTREGVLSEYQYAVEKAETTGKYAKPAEYWQQFKDAIASEQAVEGKRKARSGKEYKTWEIGGVTYRVPNEDIASVVNTIKKIAQKRAFVASTLIAVNASEFFTQDLEDIAASGQGERQKGQTIEGTGRVVDEEQAGATNANGRHWIDREGVAAAFKRWRLEELNINEGSALSALGVENIRDYAGTMKEARERIELWLDRQRTSEEAPFGDPEPRPAEEAMAELRAKADKGSTRNASQKQWTVVARCLDGLFPDDSALEKEAKRHALTLQMFGVTSSKHLSGGQVSVLIEWASIGGDGEDKWEPNPIAMKEATAIVKLYEAERGQADMFAQDEAEETVQPLPGHASDGREIPY